MLESFPGVNSVTVATQSGPNFPALFRREFHETKFGGELEVEDRMPVLVCVEADAELLELNKDQMIEVEGEGSFRIKRRSDQDAGLGPGFSRILLKSA